MAIVLGDVYQLNALGNMGGTACRNTYWYRLTSWDEVSQLAEDAITEFLAGILAEVVTFQMSTFNWSLVECFNWKDPLSDYSSAAIDVDGVVTAGTAIPLFATLTMRSPKAWPGSRYGYKRYSGISNGAVGFGGLVNPALYVTLGNLLGSDFEVAGGLLTPTLVIRAAIPPVGTGNPSVSRDLRGEWTAHLGSQNSRKGGVGE